MGVVKASTYLNQRETKLDQAFDKMIENLGPVAKGIARIEFSLEAPQMTMQIAMKGTDGVVLASDLKWIGDAGGQRETHYASKIKFSERSGIAVGCSDSEVSLNIATKIIEELKASDYSSFCSAAERIAYSVMIEFDRNRIPRPQSQCLIILQGDRCHLYSLKVGIEGENCVEILDKRRAGDAGNQAMFFSEAYYALKPINKLAFLAAHIVLTAAQFNSEGIGGLEVILCDKRGFRMLSSENIEELKARSSVLEKTIRKAFK